MDRRHRDVNAKYGSGGRMNSIEWKQHKAEKLRELQRDTIDISKDPYIRENHLGTFDCVLCKTVHPTQTNYLTHATGRRHRKRLINKALAEEEKKKKEEERRLFLEKKSGLIVDGVKVRKSPNIGKPAYRVTKINEEGNRSFKFEVWYPDHEEGFIPQYRVMSTYEQKREERDNRYQFLLFACYPYKTIAFKIPRVLIARTSEDWEPTAKAFTLQVYFTEEEMNSYVQRYHDI